MRPQNLNVYGFKVSLSAEGEVYGADDHGTPAQVRLGTVQTASNRVRCVAALVSRPAPPLAVALKENGAYGETDIPFATERYTAFICTVDSPDEREEIDIDALHYDHAMLIARSAAASRDFVPGCFVTGPLVGPRVGLYF